MTRRELERQFLAWTEGGPAPAYTRSGEVYLWAALEAERDAAETGGDVVALLESGASNGTLVCSAGSTPQAALLAAALLKPREVLLLGAGGQDGAGFLSTTHALLRDYHSDLLVTPLEIDDKDATRAFRAIDRALQGRPKPWIIDITGGKKSMAVTAFFLAVERDAIPVYLDGSHAPEVRFLRPCTARLTRLPNPAAGLGLHLLRRAQNLWTRCDFSAAAEALRETKRLFDLDSDALDSREHQQLDIAIATADAYTAWEAARYANIPSNLIPLPEPVKPLVSAWPTLVAADAEAALRARPELLSAYLVDAMRWLRRTGDRNRNMAFLRLFALGELAACGLMETYRQQGCVQGPVDYNSAIRICRALGRSPEQGTPRLESSVSALTDIEPWTRQHHWRTYRNGCAHGLAEVTRDQLLTLTSDLDRLFRACFSRWQSLGSGLSADLVPWMDTPLEGDIQTLGRLLPTLVGDRSAS